MIEYAAAVGSKTLKLKRTTRLAREGSFNAGAGKDDRLPIGILTGDNRRHRALLRPTDNDIPNSFYDSMVGISRVKLWLYKVSYFRVNDGNDPRISVRAATTSETEGTSDTLSSSNGGGAVWPGPSTHSGSEVTSPSSGTGALRNVTGEWMWVDVTDPALRWAPSRLGGNSQPCRGLVLAHRLDDWTSTPDYTGTTNNAEFASDDWGDGGKAPYLEYIFDDNHPPSPPTILSPVAPAPDAVAQIDGLALVMRIRRNDEDAGDWITGTEIQAWTEGSEMDADGAVTGGSLLGGLAGAQGQWTVPGSGRPTELLLTVTGWTPGWGAKVRVRTRDRRATWGRNTGASHGWSPFLLVHMDTRPRPPTQLYLFDLGSTSPDFAGAHDDPDPGSSLAAVETQVWEVTTRGIEMLQNTTSFVPTTLGESGTGTVGDEEFDGSALSTRNGTGGQPVAGGTAWRVPYTGQPLIEGHRYARRHRTVDQFWRVGTFSAVLSWTVVNANLPQAIPEQGVKQDTRTPVIGATLAVPFDRIQMRGYPSVDSSVPLLDTGEVTVSPANTIAVYVWGSIPAWTLAASLQWGQTVWIERRVRRGGTWTDYAPREAMPINFLPRSPLVSVEGSILRPDETWVIETATPRIIVEARDRDLPGDTITRRVIEFRTSPTGAPVHTSDVTAGLSALTVYDVPAGTFALETQLYIRARTADSSGQFGPSSADVALLLHQAPTVVAGSPPNPNDPTPTINAGTIFHGGHALDHAVVRLEEAAVLGIWDETYRDAEVTAFPYVLPAGVLRDDTRMRATVVVCDTAGLCTVMDPNTALYAEAVFGLGAIILSAAAWATTLPPVDTFTRTVADGWGSASTAGGAWTTEGTAADFDVNGTEGTIALPAAGAIRAARLDAVALGDADAVVKVKSDKLAAGGPQHVAVLLREQPNGDNYFAFLGLQTDATVTLSIGKSVGGALTTIAGPVTTALTHVSDTYLSIRFEVAGTTIRARAWLSSGAEPGTWDLSATDATAALGAPGSVGLRAGLVTGATNAPVVTTWDALTVT